MTNDEQFMIECITTELVECVMTEFHFDLEKALTVVYNSDTYSLLCDSRTGLYYQSPLYVYDYLKAEIQPNATPSV